MKPITTLFLLSLLSLLCVNCNDVPEQGKLLAKLQGDWVGKGEAAVLIIDQDKMVESQPWLIKDFEPFRLQKEELMMDSIRYRKTEGIKTYRFEIRYKVDYLVGDTLKLIKYGIADPTQQEVLSLQRLKPLGQYELKKLSISSSPCHAACPVFQIEIKGDGNIKFQGESFNDRKGNYKGKLSAPALDLIRMQVDKVDWKQLAESYWEEGSGGQYFRVEMEDQLGQKYSLVTNSTQLKALNILIFRTFKLVAQHELKKVTEALSFSTDLTREHKKQQ